MPCLAFIRSLPSRSNSATLRSNSSTTGKVAIAVSSGCANLGLDCPRSPSSFCDMPCEIIYLARARRRGMQVSNDGILPPTICNDLHRYATVCAGSCGVRSATACPGITGCQVAAVRHRTFKTHLLRSRPIVAIQFHHLAPSRHEVSNERLLRVAARIDFRESPELGV